MSLLKEYQKELGIDECPNFLYKYLECESLKRLNYISYFCGMDYASKDIYNFLEPVSRLDHSINTFLITWKFTYDKTASLAALFHDVASPCFSHVIDYMNKDYVNQESTEEYTKLIMENDKFLRKLLKEDHLEIEQVSDFKKYSIVDINRPKLCADRFDGIICPGLFWTKCLYIDEAKEMVRALTVYNNEDGKCELGFNDENIARYALKVSDDIAYACQTDADNYMMDLLANITKRLINNKIISYNDLFSLREFELIDIISNANDTEIQKLFYIFKTIKKSQVPKTDLVVKQKELNPLVLGRRLK